MEGFYGQKEAVTRKLKKNGLYQAKSASLGDCRGSYQAGYLRPGISRWAGSRLTLGRG